MATLQQIRSKGPLLIIVIGLALFAFIAGDAWKVLQPTPTQDVGEINGKTISAQEYQQLVEEFTEMVKLSNNLNSLTEEQSESVKNQVWNVYVNNKLIADEAKKIGLAVTDTEVQAIIDAGTHPLLANTPFFNPNTGRFDKDALKKFLVEYASVDRATLPAQYLEQYDAMHKIWLYIEKSIRESRLADKYNSLIEKSISSNPIEAKAVFDAKFNQSNIVIAAVPYSSVSDSTIKVKSSEVKELYNKRKEQYKQLAETRDIKYIDVQVTASDADRTNIQNEVIEYSAQLNDESPAYAAIVRSAASTFPYVDMFYTKAGFPADVVARLDSAAIGEVYGPYYNAGDNTINAFKKIAKATLPDSVQYRQIQVYDEDITKGRTLADSIYNALKGGAKFEDLAAKYNQSAEATWISSANYEGAQLDSDNLKYLSAITTSNVNEITNVSVGVANVIVQVTNRKVMTDKYKVAVIKRPVEFSPETYNKAYNDFSQFIAANPTLDDMNKNAEDAGYRLLERKALSSAESGIGGLSGSKEALRWSFGAKKGEVSRLYECGNNDRLLVVGLSEITPKGYVPVEQVQSQLWSEVAKEKKAEKIIADMTALNATSIEQYASMDAAVIDTIKHISFSVPAYVSALYTSEAVVSAYATVAEQGKVSNPIKANAGVVAMKVYETEPTTKEFNAVEEKATMTQMYQRQVSRYISDLYIKGNVVDNRYLFF
ncbi:peptidylprolyl isomerase [Bacteroides sp. 214]|uniref:peptidylprolyl isomerase n=1 Tax=Bacteroides sp. 214 TaxID=2302935 RepID=UPI0013D1AEFF|nr:peptidylprolyl isomerase [Bacteroides sp. 214]NDW13255.1 peptidylprolyl isomerase [Bacteroides sp. 214]